MSCSVLQPREHSSLTDWLAWVAVVCSIPNAEDGAYQDQEWTEKTKVLKQINNFQQQGQRRPLPLELRNIGEQERERQSDRETETEIQ